MRRSRKNPWGIQELLSAMPYNPGDHCKSAAETLKKRTAHCMEGALLGAFLLEDLGHEPALLHFRAHRDDDHAVALFRERGLWGALGKSNTTLLAWRPPIYRTLESLLMSYWPFYFNTRGQMSLLAWAGPVRLKRYESWRWRDAEGDISEMSATFYDRETERRIMNARQIEKLPVVGKLLMKACFLGADRSGLYRA